ncbi:hypothetical protein SAMN04489717_0946 [Actinopolymorpha singaporensis]|uniref:Uncharacterized protein n=2 Tax=Actinopolymorpha singaporensis TaxID=117157 RepID=A0A1H1MTN9_9ACTN|nr:hypothetical protein SAMN04489717_0946 [Actinopolymorpha singaporensis]
MPARRAWPRGGVRCLFGWRLLTWLLTSPHDGRMADEVRAVFVFDRDHDALVFRSLEHATGYMEAIDVEEGEYVALFTETGGIVNATTTAERVVLTVTGERDEADLRARLRDHQRRMRTPEPITDPVAFASDYLRREREWEWAHRWPRWPAWLDRRLHGEHPPKA